MDPNEALKRAREASNKIGEATTPDEAASAAVDLMMYFDALDQVMSRGMFPPNEWIRKSNYAGRRTVSPRGF